MDEDVKVWLRDVLDAIEEVESYFSVVPKRFDEFLRHPMCQKAVERQVEIMGEAINRILRRIPDFPLPNARSVVQTRNRVIHSYDSVTPEFLWSLVIKFIPRLKEDIIRIADEDVLNSKL